MLTNRLINELGMMKLTSRNLVTAETSDDASPQQETSEAPQAKETQRSVSQKSIEMQEVKLDKNEFRLLVKMLQAIGHDCTYDHIAFDGTTVTYQHPDKTLVFNDINLPDSKQIMNLSSLGDLLSTPDQKRAVWEKLKTLT